MPYQLDGRPGTPEHAYVERRTHERLEVVSELLAERSPAGHSFELLIKDAYRAPETQAHIYEEYVAVLQADSGLSYDEAYQRAALFVTEPKSVFPHGTGGTVDVWLLDNGTPQEMGTGYDEFTERAHRDYFLTTAPCEPDEIEAHKNRTILRAAMEDAGFAGLDSEWWHFEYGTARWATASGQAVLYDRVLPPPIDRTRSAAYREHSEMLQPTLWAGVAQPFGSATDRAAALAHRSSDHYYSRSSHPTVAGLERCLEETLTSGAPVIAVSSGITACRTALLSLVPDHGVVVYDKRIYYEISQEMDALAEQHHWRAVQADFSDLESLASTLKYLKDKPDVLYCDSPMNWWLGCIDLSAVGNLAHDVDAVLVADITVQPIQPKALDGADVIVFSLSKYPSLGYTIGGAIATSNNELFTKIDWMVSRQGDRMSNEAAEATWRQVVSLHDRMTALTLKVQKIVEALEPMDEITSVRHAQPNAAGAYAAGIVIAEFADPRVAAATEKIVGHNARRPGSALHLAYTFGSAMTTVEHFASNPRPELQRRGFATPSIPVPPTFFRIGVGAEPVEKIISELTFSISAASGHVSGRR